jgi:hypothetical protein
MKLLNIIFECRDTSKLADFWISAVGRQPEGGGYGIFVGLPNGSEAAGLYFIDKPARSASDKHAALRFTTSGDLSLEEEVKRLVELGASVVEKYHHGWGVGEVLMADPEGNRFLIESGDRDTDGVEERMERYERGTAGPFWADAVPPSQDGEGTAVVRFTEPGSSGAVQGDRSTGSDI